MTGGLDARFDGAALLDELHRAFSHYVVFPAPEAADGVVLWTAATHAQAAWQHATRLHLTSPVKRCGKSRLLDLISATCYQPVITVNISPAALVRVSATTRRRCCSMRSTPCSARGHLTTTKTCAAS
jgi:hypothetical protein